MHHCINFDFGKRWNDIVPFLQTKEMKQLLKITHAEIAEDSEYGVWGGGFKEDTAPAVILTKNDAHCTMTDTMLEAFTEAKDPRIPAELLQEYLDAKNSDFDEDDDSDAEQNYFERLGSLEQQLYEYLGLNYKTNPTHLYHWMAFGTCHWLNRHIGIHLARKVCPEMDWKVLKTPAHTTVISTDGRSMFDLLAYGWNYDRFKAYCCRQPYIEIDPSLGADEAIGLLLRDTNLRLSTLLQRAK